MLTHVSPKMQAYLAWCEDRGLTLPSTRAVALVPVILSAAKDLFPKVTFIVDERSSEAPLDDELLAKMTAAMGLTADDYSVLNMADEPHLGAKLVHQKPQAVVVLGANTALGLLGDEFTFEQQRGQWLPTAQQLATIPTIVTHHPRDLRHQPATKRAAWQDLQAVMRVLIVLCCMMMAIPVAATEAGTWLEVPIGVISPASEDVLNTAVETRTKHGYVGIVLTLDTPGGTLDSTRNMVKTILGADFPIIVWVGPAGSRAGSAGAFLTLAGHVAAMAPGTNIGAAHPVDAKGGDVPDSEIGRKITNDTIAFIESIAQTRGRNVDMARSFVATSVSITDAEALEHGVIDVIAKDLNELFDKIDGREVELNGGLKTKLATKGAPRTTFELSLRQQLLTLVSNPNLFYLLFMVGLIGIGYELTHPGVIFPGVIGGICMLLALIATSVLPVSFGAAGLILFGIALLIAEAFVPSFGTLGIGGMVALILGSVFLVDPSNEEGLRISWYTIAPVAGGVGLGFLALGFIIMRSTTSPVRSGSQVLIGTVAIALQDFQEGTGQVRAQGTIWSAKTSGAVANGSQVVVTAIEGLILIVKPLS